MSYTRTMHGPYVKGIALAMFGGQEKIVKGKTRLRGDINMLLLGDPGRAVQVDPMLTPG